MKNFIITEDEKKSILGKYYSKQIINEQKFLAKFFTGTADDIVKNFGDDVAKSLDDVFAKVYSHSGNIVSKAEGAVIKSLSGAEVPITTIQSLIKLVSEGKIQANQVLNYLPRKLADGTEFRNLMQQAFEKKGVQKVTQSTAQGISKLPLGSVGQSFKEMASQIGGWLQIKNVVGNMSGWKFHVYADNLDEAAFLYEKLLPIANKHGAGMKVASSQMLDRLSQSTIQKGKGVTLYLPSSVVEKNAQKEFLSDIQSAIKGYEKSGQISGDKMITDNIGYRYELSKPINASKGVDMNQYSQLYKSNEEGATHNITGNLDLF
jgi:hypothetical protein